MVARPEAHPQNHREAPLRLVQRPDAPPEPAALSALEAEQWILGALLDEPPAEYMTPDVRRTRQGEMLTSLAAGAFALPQHAAAWETAQTLWRAGQSVTYAELWLALTARGLHQLFARGIEDLAWLALNQPTTVGWEHFAERVADAGRRRQLVTLLHSTQERLTDRAEDVDALVVQTVAALAGQSGNASGRRLRSVGEAIDADAAAFAARLADPCSYSGMVTGLDALDYFTDGFRPSEITIAAALTSGGKTILALDVARRLARGVDGQPPVPVFYCSAEMIAESLARRAIFATAGIDPRQGMKQRAWTAEQRAALADAAAAVRGLPLYVEDGDPADWYALMSQIDLAVARYGIGFVVLDHLHLLHVKGFRGNRTEELATIVAGMKHLATRHRVPVLALAQLNRGENAGGAFVDLNRIKGNSDIDQAADVVLFLERPAQGVKPPPAPCVHTPWWQGQQRYCNPVLHEARLHFVKVRSGETGARDVWVDLPSYRVADVERA